MKTRTNFFILFIIAGLFSISCNNQNETELKIIECPDFDVEEGTISDEREYQIIDAVIKK